MKKVIIFMSTLALLVSAKSFSHGVIGMTYPEDGSTLKKQAERVEMHFKSAVKLISLKVVPDVGSSITLPINRAAKATKNIVVKMPELAPSSYKVQWKAMGNDGHIMKGSFGFKQH